VASEIPRNAYRIPFRKESGLISFALELTNNIDDEPALFDLIRAQQRLRVDGLVSQVAFLLNLSFFLFVDFLFDCLQRAIQLLFAP